MVYVDCGIGAPFNYAKHTKMTHVFFVFVQNLQDFKFREFMFSNKIVKMSDLCTALYYLKYFFLVEQFDK